MENFELSLGRVNYLSSSFLARERKAFVPRKGTCAVVCEPGTVSSDHDSEVKWPGETAVVVSVVDVGGRTAIAAGCASKKVLVSLSGIRADEASGPRFSPVKELRVADTPAVLAWSKVTFALAILAKVNSGTG